MAIRAPDGANNDGGYDGYPIAHLLLINTLSPHLERKQNFGEMRVMSLKLMGLRPMDFFLRYHLVNTQKFAHENLPHSVKLPINRKQIKTYPTVKVLLRAVVAVQLI